MITCTRRLQFAAGHRVFGHESKCGSLHGHNYVVLITAVPYHQGLDAVGRVVDFSVLKAKYGDWIEENWDHAMILNKDDQEAIRAVLSVNDTNGKCNKHYLMDFNPTAENMARFLLDMGPRLMSGTGVLITKVVVWETENCYSEALYD